ncbi:MAG: hypothetical protein KF842_04950 [Caulobacter sp.]|nr:hypothetical protein [Caulobacter sp.]
MKTLPFLLLSGAAAGAVMAAPAFAAPVDAELVTQFLDQACPAYLGSGQLSALSERASTFGLATAGANMFRADGTQQIVATGRTMTDPVGRYCRVSFTGAPDYSARLSASMPGWAKAHGFKLAGKPSAQTDEKGRRFVQTLWKARGQTLEMDEMIPEKPGQVNIILKWSAET